MAKKNQKVMPNISPEELEKSKIDAIKTQAMADIIKRYGDGIVFVGDDVLDVDVISTGIISLDKAIGAGGIPRGRITTIYGAEASGKTTIALSVIAEAQRSRNVCLFVDAENALVAERAEMLGVQMEKLFVSQPDSAEQAMEVVEAMIRSGQIDVIVVDSVAALAPRAEIEGEMGDSHVALLARLMSQAMRKISKAVKDSNCTVIFINQIREKVGVMFGSPITTPGGRALKFYSSLRLEVKRIQQIKGKLDGETGVIGAKTLVKVQKNKVAAPFKEANFDILYYDEGISTLGEIIDIGVDKGIIEKRGAFYKYNDEVIGQGRDNSRLALLENTDLAFELHNKVRVALGLDPLDIVPQYDGRLQTDADIPLAEPLTE